MNKRVYLCLFIISSTYADSELEMVKKQLDKQDESMKQLQEKVAYLQQQQKQSANKSASFSQSAYMPDMALILNMSALSRDVNNGEYKDAAIPGFIGKSEMHLPFNKNSGFKGL